MTPKFWDDLWLNEGFADYMSYEGVHDVRPDWGIWQRFVIDEVQHVMTLDSLKSSHPISGILSFHGVFNKHTLFIQLFETSLC